MWGRLGLTAYNPAFLMLARTAFLVFRAHFRKVETLALLLCPDDHSLGLDGGCRLRQKERHADGIAPLQTADFQLNTSLANIPCHPEPGSRL